MARSVTADVSIISPAAAARTPALAALEGVRSSVRGAVKGVVIQVVGVLPEELTFTSVAVPSPLPR